MQHSGKTIQEIIQMRKAGFTLGEITSKTRLKKSTIYHHIQSIPRSEILIQKIKEASRRTQKMMADKRRGKSVKTYAFAKPKKWTTDFVNLVAHFLFDGQINHAGCIYYNRSEKLRDVVIEHMKKILSVDDYKTYETFGGVKRIAYFNVEIGFFIKQKADELLIYILFAPKEHKLSFLRAFFDDEGCITCSKHKKYIRGYQHSLPILMIIKKLLLDFGIESKIDEKYFELYISRKDNLLKFKKYINFTPGLCVNGKRSNSIWKESLEKPEILQRALKSY